LFYTDSNLLNPNPCINRNNKDSIFLDFESVEFNETNVSKLVVDNISKYYPEYNIENDIVIELDKENNSNKDQDNLLVQKSKSTTLLFDMNNKKQKNNTINNNTNNITNNNTINKNNKNNKNNNNNNKLSYLNLDKNHSEQRDPLKPIFNNKAL